MIDDFVYNRMSSYIVGGMKSETAARFTRGELLAIYRRQHDSRDKSGAWQITPLPENITTTAAMKKADKAITEILNYYAQNAGDGPPLNKNTNSSGGDALSGFDKMADYAKRSA